MQRMRFRFLKYLSRNWTKWVLVLITVNIVVFMFVLKNQGLVFYSNIQDDKMYVLNKKVQNLFQDVQNEILENRIFMKNLLKVVINQLPANSVEVKSQYVSSKRPQKPYTHCSSHVIPILVITCNRPSGLETTLKQLINYRKISKYEKGQFPIYISQGCNHKPTEEMVTKYKTDISGTLLYHQKDEILAKLVKVKRMIGYFKISDHYKYAIDWVLGLNNATTTFQLFTNENLLSPDSLLIVEDDLNISSDFYSYFKATNSILRNDKSLFCVSAWNDNGKSNLVDSNATAQLYRTDFFPGLGWMMLRSFWYEIRDKWPNAFWDEYLRQPEVRKGRQCIRPEIPRTATFGSKGVSNGQFFEKHLKFLLLNDKAIDFCQTDITYLTPESSYRNMWQDLVYNQSMLFSLVDFLKVKPEQLPNFIRIEYSTNKQFSEYAKKLSLMDDVKSGVQRTAYRGVVTFMQHHSRVFLSPSKSWTNYLVS